MLKIHDRNRFLWHTEWVPAEHIRHREIPKAATNNKSQQYTVNHHKSKRQQSGQEECPPEKFHRNIGILRWSGRALAHPDL